MITRNHTATVTTLVLVSMLAACGTQPPLVTETPSATGAGGSMSADPHASQSASPRPATTDAIPASGLPTPAASVQVGLHANTAVRVIVTELNIREGPSTSTTGVATVKRGSVFVLGGYLLG